MQQFYPITQKGDSPRRRRRRCCCCCCRYPFLTLSSYVHIIANESLSSHPTSCGSRRSFPTLSRCRHAADVTIMFITTHFQSGKRIQMSSRSWLCARRDATRTKEIFSAAAFQLALEKENSSERRHRRLRGFLLRGEKPPHRIAHSPAPCSQSKRERLITSAARLDLRTH